MKNHKTEKKGSPKYLDTDGASYYGRIRPRNLFL